MTVSVSYEDWLHGNAVLLGRAVMDPLTPAQQVARAVAVLDLCRSRWSHVQEVQLVSQLGAAPERWREGHDGFDAVRSLALEEGRKPTSDVYRALLDVAEIAAKIIYNASGQPAPFDRGSPVRLSPYARSFIEALGDHGFGVLVWAALTSAPHGA
jgi:hypothetical protein